MTNDKKYKVLVDDNFHLMDESERYERGEYSTSKEAIEICKKIVDDCLAEEYEKGMTAQQLYEKYMGFGDDPFIYTGQSDDLFYAWDYAKKQCDKICNQ